MMTSSKQYSWTRLGSDTMETVKIKSKSKSVKAREEGNNLHRRQRFFEALLCYNKSLCYANSSLLKSLAFADRSATYFELTLYKKCIENIKLAREQGYPTDKRQKLDELEAKCIYQLAESERRGNTDAYSKIENIFKLSYPANSRIPFIVESIQLRQDEQNGREIYTTMDFKPGDVIAAEDIFHERRTNKTDYERCIRCSKTNMLSLIPSDYAVSIMFCSEECKDADYAYQRNVQTFAKTASEIQSAMLGVMFGKYFDYPESHDAERKTIFDFDFVNVSANDRKLIDYKCFYGLRTSTTTVQNADQIDDTFAQYVVSTFARGLDVKNIMESCSLPGYRLELPSENLVGGQCFGLFSGLLKHSCDPNIQYIIVDNKLVFFAVKPIRRNEQLFVSYGSPFYFNTKEKRHTFLNRQCSCVACVNNYPALEDLPAATLFGLDDTTKDSTDESVVLAKIEQNWKLIDKIHNQYPTKDACEAISQNFLLLLKLAYLGSYSFGHPMDEERIHREKLNENLDEERTNVFKKLWKRLNFRTLCLTMNK